MRIIRSLLAVVLVAAGLAAGACGGGDSTPTVPSPAPPAPAAPAPAPPAPAPAPPPTEPIDPNDWTAAAIANLTLGYTGVQGVWTGFDPGEHPSVVPYKSDRGEVESALAINFPSPERLGEATALIASAPFRSLHRIADVNADTKATLSEIPHFDFNAVLGGVDSFVMVARAGDRFLDPSRLNWAAFFIHEMFHRYQFERWAPRRGSQDIENYAFDADNIALATLEERALREAVTSGDRAKRETAARRFAAIRRTRILADRRVVLDNDQERSEGSARYLEHRLAGDDTRFHHHGGNYEAGLIGDSDTLLQQEVGIKEHYAFGRFYSTGAAVLRTLDLLGAAGVAGSVERGKSPADVLIEHVGIRQADLPRLVAAARAAYDPDNELPAAAERAAAAAAKEGPVFPD